MKVLVVDDSRAIRVIIKKILEEMGFQVLEAEHGQTALHVLEGNSDIVLMMVDWNMPVMNGLDLIKAVRKEGTHKDMWIMMVTTETEMDNMAKAMVAGANEYVMKPFTKEIIQEKIKILGLVNP